MTEGSSRDTTPVPFRCNENSKTKGKQVAVEKTAKIRSTSRPLPSPSCTLSANKRRKLKDDAEVQVLKSIAQSLAKSDEKNVTNNSTDHKAEDDVSAFCAYVEQCMR